MKIIRKFSGFTTNSSASSEWLAPEIDPDADPTAEPAVPSGTETTGANTISPDQPQTPPGLPTWSKPLITIGIVGILIIGLFLLEKLIRRIWKKVKGLNHEN